MFSINKNEQETIGNLQALIEQIANESIASRGEFFIGFSGNNSKPLIKSYKKIFLSLLGGSLGKYLCQCLPKINTEWTKWTVFFCDERYVPENDAESTFGFVKALHKFCSVINNSLIIVAFIKQI